MSMVYDKDLDKIKFDTYFNSGTVGLKYPSVTHNIKGEELFIYIEGTVVGNFDLILSATDVIGQTSEALISVSVYRCASRDWMKWVGSYEIDWTFWDQDFILDKSTGKCYHSYSYL